MPVPWGHFKKTKGETMKLQNKMLVSIATFFVFVAASFAQQVKTDYDHNAKNWHSPRSQGEEDYRFQPEALITCKNRPISDEATVVLVFLCRSLSISCRGENPGSGSVLLGPPPEF